MEDDIGTTKSNGQCFERIETGVMVMKDGKAWGAVYSDGRSTEYGWIDPTMAPIHDPLFCTRPTDVTYKGSFYMNELETAEIVSVERRTIVKISQKKKGD